MTATAADHLRNYSLRLAIASGLLNRASCNLAVSLARLERAHYELEQAMQAAALIANPTTTEPTP